MELKIEPIERVQYVTLRQLAHKMGMDPSNARKYVLKMGFGFLRVRTPESGNQMMIALSLQDAETVIEHRQEQGFGAEPKLINGEQGCFYVVQLVPELAPQRVKLGFAAETNSRLQAHRTSAPTAILLKSWPCRRVWEVTAIASLTRVESCLIANEVYECESIENLLARGDVFFSLLPGS